MVRECFAASASFNSIRTQWIRIRKQVRKLVVLGGAYGLAHFLPVAMSALPLITKCEFQISYLPIGVITLLPDISLALASIPAGMLADASYNKGGLIGVSFLLVALGCALLFFTHTLMSAVIILMSISALLNVSRSAAQSHLCTAYRDKKGSMLRFYAAGGNVGMIIAPLGVNLLAINYGWRALYLVWGGLSILIFLWICLVFRNDYPQMRREKNRIYLLRQLIEVSMQSNYVTLSAK